MKGAGGSVGCGGERLPDQSGALETTVPTAVGTDPAVQFESAFPEIKGVSAVRLVKLRPARQQVALRGPGEAEPALLGGLATAEAERRGDLRPGRAGATGPVYQFQFLGVEIGPPGPDAS
jgi:hypothetical protein